MEGATETPVRTTEKRRTLTAVLLLFGASLGVRLLYLAEIWNSYAFRYPVVDSRAYQQRGLGILNGEWLYTSIPYQDPLYPYFLAGLWSIFGTGPAVVPVAQTILGSATVVLIFDLARRVFGFGCGVLAGILAAGYKLFWFYDPLMLKVSLSLFLVVLALWLLIRAEDDDAPLTRFGAGLVLGLASLTRGNYLLFIAAVIAWLAIRPGDRFPLRLRRTGLVAAGVALALAPVTLRNYQLGGEFVLITSQAGQNFYIGNQRWNKAGVYQAPTFVSANPFSEEPDFRREAERRTGHSMKPGELSRYWMRQAFAEIRADPGQCVTRTLRKVRGFLNDFEIPDNQSYAYYRTYVSRLLRIPLPTWGALLPLAICGSIWFRRDDKARLLSLFALSYFVSVVLFFVTSRYRMPVVPVLIVLASAAVARVLALVRQRALLRLVPALLFLGAAYPFVFHDFLRDDLWTSHFNIGFAHAKNAESKRGEAARLERTGFDADAREARVEAETSMDLAEESYRRGLAARPKLGRVRRALRDLLLLRVTMLVEAKDPRAVTRAEELIVAYPRSADAWALLGSAHAAAGNEAEARRAFEHALGLAPDNPRALRALVHLGPSAEP